jgi:transcriptional regulator with XRE-family HTH domain
VVPTHPRNQGIRLSPEALDRQLALRGLTARKLAELSGVSETAISQARNGRRRISDRTLRRITTALLGVPLMLGAELIIGPGESE